MADFLRTPEQLALRTKMAEALHEKWQLTEAGTLIRNTYGIIDDLREVSAEFDLLFNPLPQMLLPAVPDGWELGGIEWENGAFLVWLLRDDAKATAEASDNRWETALQLACERAVNSDMRI